MARRRPVSATKGYLTESSFLNDSVRNRSTVFFFHFHPLIEKLNT